MPSTPTTWHLGASASIGAGLIHLASSYPNLDHAWHGRSLIVAGAGQLVAGGALVVRTTRLRAAAVFAVNLAVVSGWVVLRVLGVDWLEAHDLYFPGGPGLVDTVDALLGLTAAVVAGAVIFRVRWSTVLSGPLAVGAIAIVTIPGMVYGASAAEDGEHAHAAHAHGIVQPGASSTKRVYAAYNAVAPVNLGGLPGVSAEQQSWAQSLVDRTLDRLPKKWAKVDAATAAGFMATSPDPAGYVRYVNWSSIGHETYNPDHPEGLLYLRSNGSLELVAAMYMLSYDRPVAQVPKPGGALMNFTDYRSTLAIYVWVVPNRCGAFAGLPLTSAGEALPVNPCDW